MTIWVFFLVWAITDNTALTILGHVIYSTYACVAIGKTLSYRVHIPPTLGHKYQTIFKAVELICTPPDSV